MGSSRPSGRSALVLLVGLVAAALAEVACSPFDADTEAGADAGAGLDGAPAPGAMRDAAGGATDAAGEPGTCFAGASVCESFEDVTDPRVLVARGWTSQDGLVVVGEAADGTKCLRTQVSGTAQEARIIRTLTPLSNGTGATLELFARVIQGRSLDVAELRTVGGDAGVYVGLKDNAWSVGQYRGSTFVTTAVTGVAADGWHRVRITVKAPATVTVHVDGVPVTLGTPPQGLSFFGGITARVGVFSTTPRDVVDVDLVGVASGRVD